MKNQLQLSLNIQTRLYNSKCNPTLGLCWTHSKVLGGQSLSYQEDWIYLWGSQRHSTDSNNGITPRRLHTRYPREKRNSMRLCVIYLGLWLFQEKASSYSGFASLGGFYNKPGCLTKHKYKGNLHFGKVKVQVLFESWVRTQQVVLYIF